jgi:hypothetical protein
MALTVDNIHILIWRQKAPEIFEDGGEVWREICVILAADIVAIIHAHIDTKIKFMPK